MSRHAAADVIEEKTPLLSNRAYTFLKYVATIFLPASSALYYGLSQIWGFPYAEQVVGSIALISTFLGAVILVSTRQYNNSDTRFDGALIVDTSDNDKDVYSFEVSSPLEDLKDKKELAIKVLNPG